MVILLKSWVKAVLPAPLVAWLRDLRRLSPRRQEAAVPVVLAHQEPTLDDAVATLIPHQEAAAHGADPAVALTQKQTAEPVAEAVAELPEWEMVADTSGAWETPGGWSHDSIVAVQVEALVSFVAGLEKAQPFGGRQDSAADGPIDVGIHNMIMTFGYLLGRTAAECPGRPPSVLDWGGGVGLYWQFAEALYPGQAWDYWIKDLPGLCAEGARRSRGATFVSDDEAVFSRRFDLVFASSSLQYTRDVFGLLQRLCRAATTYLMVTRVPFVEDHEDFVVVQRPYRYGYHTEYAGWFLNRRKFQCFVEAQGFVLDREFSLGERPYVANAPEQCRCRGFLFKRVAEVTGGS